MLDPSLSPSPLASTPAARPATPRGRPEPAPDLHPPSLARRGLARLGGALGHLLRLARPATSGELALLLGLLAVDLALIAGYLAFAYVEHYGIRESLFHGNLRFSFVEGGYPEIWGYGKQGLIALLLLGAYVSTRQSVHRALALLFVVTLLDDSLALHETLGAHLAAGAGISVRLGELVAWAAIGLVPLLVVLAAYRRADAPGRADAETVIAGFAILLFFAVGMDVAHGILRRFVEGFQTVLTLAEDGGELFALTLIAMIARGIFRRRKVSRAVAVPSGTA